VQEAEVEAEVELEEMDAAAPTHGPLPVNAIEDAIACCTITGSVRAAWRDIMKGQCPSLILHSY
jgi:hypothetical protein